MQNHYDSRLGKELPAAPYLVLRVLLYYGGRFMNCSYVHASKTSEISITQKPTSSA